MNESTIINTVPAANEMHKVPGFDPMKHLHRTINAQGESVMRLEPRYQRLWFRMACPKGRMLLNPLRITDQLAIFEAKVFFHMDDPTPASSFTANKTARETPNYIRAAQTEALNVALENAGFGIQLCDVTQTVNNEMRGPSAPPSQQHISVPNAKDSAASATQNNLSQVKGMSIIPTQDEDRTALQLSAESAAEPLAQMQGATEAPSAEPSVTAADLPLESAAVAETESSDAPNAATAETFNQETAEKTAASAENQHTVISLLDFSAPAEESTLLKESGTSEPDAGTPEQSATPNYTDETPVEDILQTMTLEEAKAFVVTQGPNAGLTMATIAARRPSSLHFFLTQYCMCGNIQKAAASMLLQESGQKKAG